MLHTMAVQIEKSRRVSEESEGEKRLCCMHSRLQKGASPDQAAFDRQVRSASPTSLNPLEQL